MSLSVSNPVEFFGDGAPVDGVSVPGAAVQAGAPLALPAGVTERSKYQPLFFIAPLVAATLSMFTGGMAVLTDFAWLLIVVLSVVFLIAEMRAFSFRWGIGGLLVYGGTLIWLGYDYMTNWFWNGHFREIRGFDEEVVARATVAVVLWIGFTLVGMRITLGGFGERWLARLPGPKAPRFWLIMAVILFAVGLIPYAFFTREGLIMGWWNDFLAGRGGSGAQWTTGRTGNANYSYGAYLAQVLQIGQMGSILGAYYAVMHTRSWMGRLVGALIWFPSFLAAFGTGTRGAVVFIALPVIGFLFIRFQAEAAAVGRRVSLRGYLWLATALSVLLLVVQIQITFRNTGFRNADLEKVQVTNVEGNAMFSESIAGFQQIPRNVAPFFDRYFGEAIIRPPYETIYWFVVSPIPRALWTTKPFDPVSRWYNSLVGHSADGVEGTTIAQGAAGYWYFRYGMWGPIEGGLIFGFMIGVAERLLRRYSYRPLTIITSLGMATFFFRCFRNLNWIEFHATMVGLGALCALYLTLRLVMADEPADPVV